MVTHLPHHRHWRPSAVVLAPCLSPTPVESFCQSQPVRTSSLSVHLLSSIACLLSLEGVECPWQKQHLSLYIVRWSAVCAPVRSSTSGKAERMKFQAAAIRSDRAVKPLLRQSYGSNKSSIKTSLSTMLWCIPFATPKVVTKVLTNDFRVFVFSLKIAIRRRKVCS